jgi:hypothetical protein
MGNVAGMGEVRSTYKVLVMKPKVTRPLTACKCRWKDTIKMDLK